jgi:hypothetical protein
MEDTMKAKILTILTVLLLVFSSGAFAATNIFGFYGLSGGVGGNLDEKDPTLDGVSDGDLAFGTDDGTTFYTYVYDDDNGNAESSPRFIAPDEDNGGAYSGDGRWVLMGISGAAAAAGDAFTFYDEANTEIAALDDDGLLEVDQQDDGTQLAGAGLLIAGWDDQSDSKIGLNIYSDGSGWLETSNTLIMASGSTYDVQFRSGDDFLFKDLSANDRMTFTSDTSLLTINQGADGVAAGTSGLIVYGYDDRSAYYTTINVSSAGTSQIHGYSNINVEADGASAWAALQAGDGGSVYVDAGDTFYWRDQDDSDASRMTFTSDTSLLTINQAADATSTGTSGIGVVGYDDQSSSYITMGVSSTGIGAFYHSLGSSIRQNQGVTLTTAAASGMYFDAGTSFYWRDVDDSYADRMTFASSTSLMQIYQGADWASPGNVAGIKIWGYDDVDTTYLSLGVDANGAPHIQSEADEHLYITAGNILSLQAGTTSNMLMYYGGTLFAYDVDDSNELRYGLNSSNGAMTQYGELATAVVHQMYADYGDNSSHEDTDRMRIIVYDGESYMTGRLGIDSYASGAWIPMIEVNDNYAYAGSGNVSTSGSSTTVTVPSADYNDIEVGDRIIANSEARTVLDKLGSNQVQVDYPIDWSAGYTYDVLKPAFAVMDRDTSERVVALGSPTGGLWGEGINVFQKRDTGGIKVFGYDDRDANYVSLYVNASGEPVLAGSTNTRITSSAAMVLFGTSLQNRTGGSFTIQDADDSNAIRVEVDSATGEMTFSQGADFSSGGAGITLQGWDDEDDHFLKMGITSSGLAQIVSQASNHFKVGSAAGSGGATFEGATYAQIHASNAAAHMYFDAGGTFYFRDGDDTDEVRVEIDSATGELKLYGQDDADTNISIQADRGADNGDTWQIEAVDTVTTTALRFQNDLAGAYATPSFTIFADNIRYTSYEGYDAELQLFADEADESEDRWKIVSSNVAADGTATLTLENYADGAAYHDAFTFSTGDSVASTILAITAYEGDDARLDLIADQGDDNGDSWVIGASNGSGAGYLVIMNDASGGYMTAIQLEYYSNANAVTKFFGYTGYGVELLLSADNSANNGDDWKIVATDNTSGYLDFQNDGSGSQASMFRIPYVSGGVYAHDVSGDTNTAAYLNDSNELGYNTSTRESKGNIETLDGASWLYDFNPIRFQHRLRGEDGKYSDELKAEIEYGLLADEVEEINPNFVFYRPDPNDRSVMKLQGIHYDRLIGPVIAEMKVLRKELTAAQKKIKDQEIMVSELRNIVNQIVEQTGVNIVH